MDKINLNINNYTIHELENLLKLPKNYTADRIMEKKIEFEKMIRNSEKISQQKRDQLLLFLDNIDNKLLSNIYEKEAEVMKEQELKKEVNDIKQYDGNHFIIGKNNSAKTATLESNKKITKTIIKRTYAIDSLFRSDFKSKTSDFTIQLPEKIDKAITMTASSIEIPLTYNNISNKLNNNIFQVIIKKTSLPDTSYNIILDDGLYEFRHSKPTTGGINNNISNQTVAYNIKEMIATKLNENIPQADISLSFFTNYKNGNSIFSISNANLNIESCRIIFNIDSPTAEANCSQNQNYQKLGWQLGFQTNEIFFDLTSSIPTPSAPLSIPSESPGYLGPRYVYLAIDDFQTSSRNYFSIASKSQLAPNILGKINIKSILEQIGGFKQGASPGDFNYSQKFLREYFGPTDITKLRISIFDEYGRVLDLNNKDWSLVLSFECFYN